MNVLFLGLGYSSSASARAMHKAMPQNLSISGTTRSPEKAESLILEKINGYVFDGRTASKPLRDCVEGACHIIHSIAPTAQGDPVLHSLRDQLVRSQRLEWMCYYSTVGVYGNFDGAWIDETAPCHPENQRSQWRLKAEQEWRDFAREKGIPLVILRLAGIYGPGRSSFDKLRKGTAKRIIKPGQVFNRIHIADIARITTLSAIGKLEGTFNVCDDLPAPPQDLVRFAAEKMQVQAPPEIGFDDAEMTPMARSFYNDNKRVSNAAIKHALGIELLYPTYQEGLSAIYYGN